MKRKENRFPLQWEEELSLRINIHKDWLRDHSSRAPYGIGVLIRGILKSYFWISLHQGMLFILCSRIQGYMLSLMNKVDSYLLLLLHVLYVIQNQFFQHHLFWNSLPRYCSTFENLSQSIEEQKQALIQSNPWSGRNPLVNTFKINCGSALTIENSYLQAM